MAAAAPSSSSTTPQGKKNDVFLSFRGADTRKNFTSHLYAALCRRSIETYIDYDLEQGDEISSLLTEIENSTISVIIFSANYASSTWCLSEIVKIIQCKENFGQIVIPVFLHVDPSNIRCQKGTFKDTFAKHEERYKDDPETLEMLQKARKALSQAANISGFDSNTGTESELVEKVAQHILIKLIFTSGRDHKDLIGVKSSIEKVENLLDVDKEKDNRVLGIWGMGGIGKTTIARAVFDKIRCEFDNSYFASRRELENDTLLQNLISLILKYPNADIYSKWIKQSLGRAKVLVVLDDVLWEDKINEFVTCLSSRSRIIMTTRDKEILKRYGVGANNIFRVEELSDEKALKLFSWSAFRQDHPISDYLSLSKRVVKYANGVPFALKELGEFLRDRETKAWESEINKLQKFPPKKIQKVLCSSYEDLDEDQQSIFLDIAFFFKWEHIDLATKFLAACGYNPEINIAVLNEKCLLTILDNKITMNDLLQAMGREIVRQESPNSPEERSRLCCHEEIIEVLEDESGTKTIEGLSLDMSQLSDEIDIRSEAFAMMTKLKLFKLHNTHREENTINRVQVSQDLQYFKLRYLCWFGYPFKSLCPKFHSKNLVALDIPHSHVEELWPGFPNFENLKHINLSHSKHLVKIKDLSCSPNLESLILEGCTGLLEFSACIEHLRKLVILNLRHCKNLEKLPSNIYELESLKPIDIWGCSKLDQTAFESIVKGAPERIERHITGSRFNDEMAIQFYATDLKVNPVVISRE